MAYEFLSVFIAAYVAGGKESYAFLFAAQVATAGGGVSIVLLILEEVTSIEIRKEYEMKITYNYVNGDTVEIEVSEEVAAFITNEDRLEYNNNHTETRRHISVNVLPEATLVTEICSNELYLEFDNQLIEVDKDVINNAINSLSDKQRETIINIYFKSLSAREYAEEKGISESSVSTTHKRALKNIEKKIKKLFENV